MNKTSNRSRSSSNLAPFALTLLLAALASPAIAADKTWVGGGANNNWSTGENWDSGTPAPNDSLIFDGNVRLTPNNDFTAGTIFQNLTFNGSADVFTLGGNALAITNPASAAYGGGLNAPYIGGSI